MLKFTPMKKVLPKLKNSLIRNSVILILLFTGIFLTGITVQAQIYEPEGLNMPGAWNSWTNPPTNNLALASSTQVTGGRVEKIAIGTPRWQTIFSVAVTGGDLIGGTYEWLFTSGATSNFYQNKWSATNVVSDSLQLYTKEGAANNNITLANGKWYTMNFEDIGYVNTRAIFMRTSAEPIEISSVSVPASVTANNPATINLGLSAAKCPEEFIFIRYSTNGWATSAVAQVTVSGTSGSAQIPGQPAGTVVSYYAFTTTHSTVTADYDLLTIKLNNNNGLNFSFTVSGSSAVVTFANLQWPPVGMIWPGTEFNVYGRAEVPGITGQPTPAPGLSAWVGYSSTNTNPATWTSWVTAGFQAPFFVYDEYVANIGAAITNTGTYYYATRFKYNTNDYVYGGYSASGGGFWDGVTNISGVLDVFVGIPEEQRDAITVYPNPTFGELIFGLSFPAVIRFSDALGRVILQKELLAGRQNLDISGFRNGVYHLQIITGDRTTHQTIIKR